MTVSQKIITLKPVIMTQDIMQDIEDRGLIHRLCPGRHELAVAPGEAASRSIYECDQRYGPHKLITVTMNRESFRYFGSHPDTEDFWLIGDPTAKPLFILIALCRKDELSDKIRSGTLSDSDFLLLRAVYNDPSLSFFSMIGNVPHGEATVPGPERPPSFYVTESRDLGRELTDFQDYELFIDHEGARQ